jgi:methylated-DNA-[protein]-cysteine S-methyltransferase
MHTYGEVAKAVGDAGAARAVGMACNRNPIPVIVPCHRVVGAGGKMVGFGGGIPRKRHLLELEARVSFESLWS